MLIFEPIFTKTTRKYLMKKFLGLILIGASLTVHTWAADKNETAKTAPITIKFEGEIHPKSVDLELLPQITNVNISENESSDNEALEKIKEEKLKTKMKYLVDNIRSKLQRQKATNQFCLMALIPLPIVVAHQIIVWQ
jgi:hypothetical protein